MPRQIVTILSTNYAGSHFLSLMLGSHSRAAHIGEVRSQRRAYRKPRVPCHLCDDLSQCPIVRGVTPGSIDNVYDTIFNNFDDANLDALVDTSKQIDWARRFVGHKRYRIRYIHLIRDPRALVRRWTQLYAGSVRKRWHERWKAARRPPGSFASLLTGRQWRVYLSRWLTENQRISRFIRRYDLDATVVTYRDAALEPEPTVRRIMTWLELPFEPGQLEYWQFDHHGSEKRDYEWIKRQQTRYFDQRWKEDLGDQVQQAITHDVPVCDYLDAQDLELTDEGLVVSTAKAQPT